MSEKGGFLDRLLLTLSGVRRMDRLEQRLDSIQVEVAASLAAFRELYLEHECRVLSKMESDFGAMRGAQSVAVENILNKLHGARDDLRDSQAGLADMVSREVEAKSAELSREIQTMSDKAVSATAQISADLSAGFNRAEVVRQGGFNHILDQLTPILEGVTLVRKELPEIGARSDRIVDLIARACEKAHAERVSLADVHGKFAESLRERTKADVEGVLRSIGSVKLSVANLMSNVDKIISSLETYADNITNELKHVYENGRMVSGRVEASLKGIRVDNAASEQRIISNVMAEIAAVSSKTSESISESVAATAARLANVESLIADKIREVLNNTKVSIDETASHISNSIVQGNSSLASQIERLRFEGHKERDALDLRLSEAYTRQSEGIQQAIELTRAESAKTIVASVDRCAAAIRQMHDQTMSESQRVLTALFRNHIQCRWQIVDAIDALLFPPGTEARCPICGFSAVRSQLETKVSECIFGGGKLERYVCPKCGAIYGPLKMMALTEAQLAEEYKQSYSVYSESDCTMLEKMAFKALNPEKGKKYLNFGAGAWNVTTKDLRAEGYDVYDYEPYAPAESNPWVFRSMDELAKMRFDGIFSNDLIEHLNNPVAQMKAMKKLLTHDGVMVHCSGCYEYAFEYTRFHLFFLTGDSLSRLCSAVGLIGELGDRLFDYSPARLCKFRWKD